MFNQPSLWLPTYFYSLLLTCSCSRAIVSFIRLLFINNEIFVRNAWIAQIDVETARTSNVAFSSKQYQISNIASNNIIDKKMIEQNAWKMFGKMSHHFPQNWVRLNTWSARWYGRNLFITWIFTGLFVVTNKTMCGKMLVFSKLMFSAQLNSINWIEKHILNDMNAKALPNWFLDYLRRHEGN